jgi:hypothetical protein
VDGTFKVSPGIFYQVFTVHVLVQDVAIAAIYSLLPNKTKETYIRFWQLLKDSSPNMQPESILSDFEMASFQAVRASFPQTEVVGCFFHLGQAVWRKIQANGLIEAYTSDEEAYIKLKSLISLAFLPTDKVIGEAFNVYS